jgi:phosphatidylinositol dimannoside acyltransferase
MPSLKGRALLALLRGATAGTRLVPRRAAEPLCWTAGAAWYAGAPAARRAVRANLRHVLGHEPSPRQVLAVFMHGALNYWDTFALPQLRPEQILGLVDVKGWEHLDAALRAGKGAILAGAHLSSVALAGQTVAARGYRVVGVVEEMNPPEVFEFLNQLRQVLGVRLYPVGPGAARELLAALRRNDVVGLVTDRDVLGTGPTVRFFGAPTTFPDGPATLSLRTGAPVLPAVAVRRRDGSFRAWIEPPLLAPRTGNAKQDVRALTQALARRLEYYIGVHPEQWTVFQRRWPDTVFKDSGA